MNIILDKCLANLTGKNSFEEISINELETFTKAYPYFSIGHLLLSKKLLAENNPGYEKQLQKTALYMPDVHWLHYQLTSKNTDTSKAITARAPLVAATTVLPNIIDTPLQTTAQESIAARHEIALAKDEQKSEVEHHEELQNTPATSHGIATVDEGNSTTQEETNPGDEAVAASTHIEPIHEAPAKEKAAETVITKEFSIEEIEEADKKGQALLEPEKLTGNTDEEEKKATNPGDEAVAVSTIIEANQEAIAEEKPAETVINKEFSIEEIEEADQKGKALLEPETFSISTEEKEATSPGDEAVAAFTIIEANQEAIAEEKTAETVITKEFSIEEIEQADQKGRELLQPEKLNSNKEEEEKAVSAKYETISDHVKNGTNINDTITEPLAVADDTLTVEQNTIIGQYTNKGKWREVILTADGSINEGEEHQPGITPAKEFFLHDGGNSTPETEIEDNTSEKVNNGAENSVAATHASENEPQVTEPTDEEALANQTDYTAPATETGEKIDESTDQMLKNIKLVLDTPLPAGQNAHTETTVPIDPYYTVDYFASQGIKLIIDDNTGDQLARNLKSFTQWLKQMKKLGPEDTLGRQGNKMDEEMVIRIADFSNIQREVITETMADVLVKQGKIEKAVQIYIKLSFLQPDKSAYFANQIKILKGIK